MSSLNVAGLSPADLAILFEPDPYAYDCTMTDPSSPFVQVMREQEAQFYAAFPEARKAAEYRARRKADILAFLASRNPNSALPRTYSGQVPQRPLPVAQTFAIPSQASDPSPLNHPQIETFTPPHTPNIHDDVPELVPSISYHTRDSPQRQQHSLHRIVDQERSERQPKTVPRQPQPPSPALHDHHPQDGQLQSWDQLDSASQQTNDSPASRDCGDRVDRLTRSRTSTPAPSSTSGRSRSRSRKNSTNTPGSKPRVAPNKRRSGTTRKKSPASQGKRQHDGRKPTLACLFCRGRKIACGAPSPASVGKTCNQCERRSLPCEFPVECRRGMRKRRFLGGSDDDDQSFCESILSP